MIEMDSGEAILFRQLAELFTKDQVLYKVSVLTVCGGTLSEKHGTLPSGSMALEDLESWARIHKCLFTVISPDGNPHLVVEFAEETGEIIDIEKLETQERKSSLLACSGVKHILVSHEEFSEITAPHSCFDLCTLLSGKLELSENNGSEYTSS